MIYKTILATPRESLYTTTPHQITETGCKKTAYHSLFKDLEQMELGSRALLQGFDSNGNKNFEEGYIVDMSEQFGKTAFKCNPCSI